MSSLSIIGKKLPPYILLSKVGAPALVFIEELKEKLIDNSPSVPSTGEGDNHGCDNIIISQAEYIANFNTPQ